MDNFQARVPDWISGRNFLALIVLVISAKVLYNIYLHPLRRFPGSKSWALSPIPVALAQLRGTLHDFTHSAHQRYGTVVRISPNELSFISTAAWGDIYNRCEGKPPLPRDKAFFNDMLVDPNTLTMADDHNHARLRRAMNPAFSPRALASQEPILQQNVDLFLGQLERRLGGSSPIDLSLWFNYITFDILGDLAFGESFGCLGKATYHEWVGFVLDHFYTATLLHVVHRFRPLNALLAKIIPASLVEKKQWHERKALETVRKRIQKRNDRPDFMQPLIQAREKGIVSADELEQQASLLILAGSETTAVALTSVTYLLLEHPTAMARLADEVRANYQKESEIDSLSIHKLRFLHAVIQESFRLFPPITNGFPREVGAGQEAIIDGRLIPSGTAVNINHWSAFRSDVNFLRASEFLPERWLDDSRFDGDAKGVFQPFSVGPRSCIGKKFAYDSIKIVLARMIWRFEVELDPQSRKSYAEKPIAFVSFQRPPLLVKLTPRES